MRCVASWPVAKAVLLLTMYTELTKWLLMRVQVLQGAGKQQAYDGAAN